MSHPVTLQIYDLSGGIAASMSQQLTGQYFPAVYHTGVIVHGYEYFFGGDGISSCVPGNSPYGNPIESRHLGQTSKSPTEVRQLLRRLSHDFQGTSYQFLSHNCNHFSDCFVRELSDGALCVPEEIVGQASRFMCTPLGQMVAPMMEQAFENSSGMSAHLEVPDTPDLAEEDDGRAYFYFTAINAQRNWTRLQSYNLTRSLSAAEEVAWQRVLPQLTSAGASSAAQIAAADAALCLNSLANMLPCSEQNTFVVLDFLRAIAATREGNRVLGGPQCPPELAFAALLGLQCSHCSAADLTMLCRVGANLAAHPDGRRALSASAEPAAQLAVMAASTDAPTQQQAAALALGANVAQCALDSLSCETRAALNEACVRCMDAHPEAAAVCMSLVE